MIAMWKQGVRATLGAMVVFGLAACGSGTGALASAKPGSVRTVTGTLKGMDKGAAVGAKLKNGKSVKAVIDPRTKKFALTLPKNESAILSVKGADKITKKIKFVRNKLKSTPGALTADAGETYAIPDDAFTGDANLGDLDWNDGEEITCGDEEGENSIFEFIDSDGDNTADWDDEYLEEWADDDWTESFGDEEWESFFEENDVCDWSEEGVCYPEEDEYFSEEDCASGGEEAEDFCYSEEDDGFTEDEGDGEDWWSEGDDGGADAEDATDFSDGGDATDFGEDTSEGQDFGDDSADGSDFGDDSGDGSDDSGDDSGDGSDDSGDDSSAGSDDFGDDSGDGSDDSGDDSSAGSDDFGDDSSVGDDASVGDDERR